MYTSGLNSVHLLYNHNAVHLNATNAQNQYMYMQVDTFRIPYIRASVLYRGVAWAPAVNQSAASALSRAAYLPRDDGKLLRTTDGVYL